MFVCLREREHREEADRNLEGLAVFMLFCLALNEA